MVEIQASEPGGQPSLSVATLPYWVLQKEADGIFRRMLDIQDKPSVTPAQLAKLPRWRKVEPFLKSYLGNTLHLLGKSCADK